MKSVTKALVVGSLIVATQAVAASTFPQGADGEPQGLPALSTYADRHGNDPVRNVGSPFPQGADGEPQGLPALSTYADRHANDPVRFTGPAYTTSTVFE